MTVTPKYHFCQRREQLSPCGTPPGVTFDAQVSRRWRSPPPWASWRHAVASHWLGLLDLRGAGITGAGLVALALAALQRLPALVLLNLNNNPLGDEGLAALVAPPQKAGTPPPPLECWRSSVRSRALPHPDHRPCGCYALAAAFKNGALPALDTMGLEGIPAQRRGAGRPVCGSPAILVRSLNSRLASF